MPVLHVHVSMVFMKTQPEVGHIQRHVGLVCVQRGELELAGVQLAECRQQARHVQDLYTRGSARA